MNFDINDLPVIRCRPTPSDAELQAERDRDHAKVIAEWERTGGENSCGCGVECWGYCQMIGQVIG